VEGGLSGPCFYFLRIELFFGQKGGKDLRNGLVYLGVYLSALQLNSGYEF